MKRVLFGVLALALSASPAWSAGLQLTFDAGKVSIDAQDVTIRQILAEWSRLGHTRIVNLERVTSGPVTLKLESVPENVALDTILRTVPGYMAAPRATYLANASLYDRILIVPTTTAVASRSGPPSAFQGPNSFPPPSSPNATQLRMMPGGLMPGMVPEPGDAPELPDDPAIAAAAAAGLVTVQAPMPGATMPGAIMPGMRPPMVDPSAPPAPAAATPSNPWNVPAGASVPGLAPPTPPPATPSAPGIRRPPQADR
jgi:hypothetical protein